MAPLTARSRRTRAAILAACGELMRNGNYRPTVTDIQKSCAAMGVKCGVRNIFHQFNAVDAIHLEAVKTDTTYIGIADKILGADMARCDAGMLAAIVSAAVTGRAP